MPAWLEATWDSYLVRVVIKWRVKHTLMTLILRSRSVKNQAVIGDVGKKKNNTTPHAMLTGPKTRNTI